MSSEAHNGVPVVAVIIPSLNTRKLIATTLATLADQLVGVNAEVVVVDMASTDGTVELIRSEFPWVRLLANTPNKGYGAAVNQGVGVTTAPWILACNSDLEFREGGAIQRLLDVGADHAEAAVLGCRLQSPDGSRARAAFRMPGPLLLAGTFFVPARYVGPLNRRMLGYIDDDDLQLVTDVGWVSGAVMLLRRSALIQVGMFDERFFMNCEEVDLCRRMHESGWAVLAVPSVTVVHCGGGSTPGPSRGLEWLAEGQARYVRKHYGSVVSVASLFLAALAFLSSLPVWAIRVLRGRYRVADAWAETRAHAAALKAASRV
ncbi:MAG: glycosyltransferase family 2 protein [Coriobacteriia bacterium]|nr:glycosyltransferase family 2 protein [Coriobacteriia bacterium]